MTFDGGDGQYIWYLTACDDWGCLAEWVGLSIRKILIRLLMGRSWLRSGGRGCGTGGKSLDLESDGLPLCGRPGRAYGSRGWRSRGNNKEA